MRPMRGTGRIVDRTPELGHDARNASTAFGSSFSPYHSSFTCLFLDVKLRFQDNDFTGLHLQRQCSIVGPTHRRGT